MNPTHSEDSLTCRNYITDFHVGFKYYEADKKTLFQIENKNYNYILFLLEGKINLSYNEFTNQICQSNEMVLIAQDSFIIGEVTEPSKYILLSFDNHFTLCDQLAFEKLQQTKIEKNDLNKLPIIRPLNRVLESIVFYINHKINCTQLNIAKQKEIFLILRSFYKVHELSSFLSPIIHKDIDFKTFVLINYPKVKTVEELAQLCNCSVRSLTRKFRVYFNDSPYSWMLKQRSRHILARIANTKTPFSDIIKEFGFSSPAHFTSYCKKYFGKNPTELRKQPLNRICPT